MRSTCGTLSWVDFPPGEAQLPLPGCRVDVRERTDGGAGLRVLAGQAGMARHEPDSVGGALADILPDAAACLDIDKPEAEGTVDWWGRLPGPDKLRAARGSTRVTGIWLKARFCFCKNN
jgi:hypothetical protein